MIFPASAPAVNRLVNIAVGPVDETGRFADGDKHPPKFNAPYLAAPPGRGSIGRCLVLIGIWHALLNAQAMHVDTVLTRDSPCVVGGAKFIGNGLRINSVQAQSLE